MMASIATNCWTDCLQLLHTDPKHYRSAAGIPPPAPTGNDSRRGRLPPPRAAPPSRLGTSSVGAMAGGAAFFDLDRTLLRGASGPLLGEALSAAGLVPSRKLPGQDLIYSFFNLVGETLPSMALARGAALAARGQSRKRVR